MNKKNLILIALFGLALTSCADTSELYPGNAYISGEFMLNRYSHYDAGIKEAKIEREIHLVNDALADGRYFNGSSSRNGIEDYSGFGQAKEWHPEDFGDLRWERDINSAGIGVWSDQSSLIGVAYGQTKKMALINDKFGRGYLSKLYNGQVRCNGWSSYSWVEIDQAGYGTIFPAELSKAKYFAMAVRGGSDLGPWRVSDFEINVTFYKQNSSKELIGTTFVLEDVELQTNRSSNLVSLVGFYFEELGVAYDPNGIVGMSVDFSLNSESFALNPDGASVGEGKTVSADFEDEQEYHIALMMMEVLFPDSTWY